MLGLLANAVLFFAMFRLLTAPDLPKRAMWSGALLGAVGFELLKQVSGLLIRSTQGQPAFQVFGLALILVVWINYFSRVVLYAAAWAWTHPLAREQHVVEPAEPVQGPPLPSVDELADANDEGGAVQEGCLRGRCRGRCGRGHRGRAGRPRRRLTFVEENVSLWASDPERGARSEGERPATRAPPARLELTEMPHPEPVARRVHDLIEPVCLVNFFSDEPNDAMAELGFDNYWDGYFAGRGGPLGIVPAEVVHAAFYNFGDGEAARHIPSVWERTTPEAAYDARLRGCVAALRRILGDLTETPGLGRAAELLTKAATSAPTEGRVMYAALRSLPMPEEPVDRLWHVSNMLREHRGDGHIAALVAHRIGGTEAHVLSALDQGIYPAETFGRIHHLPKARLAEVMGGLRARGLLDDSGRFTDSGRDSKTSIESLTDELAEAPYDALTPDELDELVADLEPIAAALKAVGSS